MTARAHAIATRGVLSLGLAVAVAIAIGAGAGAERSSTGDRAPQAAAALDLARARHRAAVRGMCLACGRPMPSGSTEVQVRGVWVPLCSEPCQSAFAAAPESFFSQLLPKGALFAEDFGSRAPRTRWLWIAVPLIAGLVGAGIAGQAAVSRARSSAARGLGRVATTVPPAICGACGALAHPAASRCAACGAPLAPLFEPETRRTGG